MADAFIYHNSLEELDNEFLFENKQYIAVSDSNGVFYASSQVKFELSQIANSGRFVSWQNSYLVVPWVVNLETPGNTVAGGTLENAFAVSLKNGYHHFINSMDVQIGNNSVVNLTNFSNMAINYKILSTASKEDEHNRLPSMNFFMDRTESISYRVPGSKTCLGETNNVIKDTIFNPDAGWGFTSSGVNRGKQKRMLQTSYNAVGGAHSVFHGTSNVNCALSGKSNVVFTPPITTGVTTSIQFNVLATIPLAQIQDLFTKLPMVRGMNVNLVLNLNAQCSSVITLGGAGTTFTSSVTTSQNGVFPAMISPLETSNGSVMTGCASVTLSVNIGKSVNNAFSHPTMTNCRLYACVYSMSPVAEQNFL